MIIQNQQASKAAASDGSPARDFVPNPKDGFPLMTTLITVAQATGPSPQTKRAIKNRVQPDKDTVV